MRRLKRLAVAAFITAGFGYLAVAIFFFAIQRKMIFPAPRPRPVRVAGAELLSVPTPNGFAHGLWRKGPAGAPVVVHFHGNAEQLDDLDGLSDRWSKLGFGFLAVEYPGYGASSDRAPSESGIYADAAAALAYLHGPLGVPIDRTIIEGFSLGTGVATEMASRGLGAKLVLVAPYTSIADVAATVVPFLPARMMVRDRFDSLSKAPRISIPVLVVHGRHDRVIPDRFGRALAARFPDARFVSIESGHEDALATPAAWDAIVAFVQSRAGLSR